MCIIILKPKNKTVPTDEILTECFKNNPHGAGIMYPVNGQIRIVKGLMTIESVLKALNAIPEAKSVPIVIHFRYATHGDKSAANTHPFPLSGDIAELGILNHYVKSAIVHNGIMPQYGDINASFSDSAFFAKLLSGLRTVKALKRAIEAHKNYGKFAVMGCDDEIGVYTLRIGDFVKFEGCFYSNNTFRPYVYLPISKVNYSDDGETIDNEFYQKYPHFAPLKYVSANTNREKTVQLKVVNERGSEKEAQFKDWILNQQSKQNIP